MTQLTPVDAGKAVLPNPSWNDSRWICRKCHRGMQISCVYWSKFNIHKCCQTLCFPVCTQILQTPGSIKFYSRSTFIGKNVQSPSITAPDSYYVVVVLDKNDEDIRRFAGRYICINVLDCSMTAIHHSYSSETNFSIMVKLGMAKANTEEDEWKLIQT